MPKPKQPRKRSPRPTKYNGERSNPIGGLRQKALWANPEYRAKMVEARRAAAAKRDPAKNYRRGVPDGMRKAEADALWAAARAKAQELHQIMVDHDLAEPLDEALLSAAADEVGVRKVVEGLTDEQKGSLALREAMVMALSPLSQAATKTQAIRTVLEWTKSKPVSKSDVRVNASEAWLEEVVKDATSNANIGATEGA